MKLNRWKWYLLFLLVAMVLGAPAYASKQQGKAQEPLRILLITGGCCHDYVAQVQEITGAIESNLNAVVTVEFNPSKKTDTKFKVYESNDWAKDFDLVIHNECTAKVTDPEYVTRILNAHRQGVPAINLHCAMHSYRWGDFKKPVKLGSDNAKWFEMIGVQSPGHGPRTPIEVKYEKLDHPVLKGLKDWTTPEGELYHAVQVFENTTVLAKGSQTIVPRQKKGKKKGKALAESVKPVTVDAPIVWTNKYGPKETRIFSISIGHSAEEMQDPNFAELLCRAVLWTTENINVDGSAKSALLKK